MIKLESITAVSFADPEKPFPIQGVAVTLWTLWGELVIRMSAEEAVQYPLDAKFHVSITPVKDEVTQ